MSVELSGELQSHFEQIDRLRTGRRAHRSETTTYSTARCGLVGAGARWGSCDRAHRESDREQSGGCDREWPQNCERCASRERAYRMHTRLQSAPCCVVGALQASDAAADSTALGGHCVFGSRSRPILVCVSVLSAPPSLCSVRAVSVRSWCRSTSRRRRWQNCRLRDSLCPPRPHFLSPPHTPVHDVCTAQCTVVSMTMIGDHATPPCDEPRSDRDSLPHFHSLPLCARSAAAVAVDRVTCLTRWNKKRCDCDTVRDLQLAISTHLTPSSVGARHGWIRARSSV